MTKFLLIDLGNLMQRCKNTQNSGDVELDAGYALHVTFQAIRASWRKFGINHLVMCLEGRSWRRDVYDGYKANRDALKLTRTEREKKYDEYFYGYFQLFTDFIKEKTNITVLQNDKCEADDFIGRWIQLHPSDEHIILSGDTDFYQLLAPNVKIFDGVKGWTISTTSVLDDKDKHAKKTRTVTKTVNGKQIKKQETFLVEPPDAEYELFFKIIRGDSSDNVLSAYPGVRENGSSKKPGIVEAFNDRHNKGFDWNNFMLQEWEKMTGVDENGNPILEKVRVIDQFKINESVIDLSKQPDHIKEILDEVILSEVQKVKKTSVGIHFLKFAGKMSLNEIGKNPMEYAEMLNEGYVQ